MPRSRSGVRSIHSTVEAATARRRRSGTARSEARQSTGSATGGTSPPEAGSWRRRGWITAHTPSASATTPTSRIRPDFEPSSGDTERIARRCRSRWRRRTTTIPTAGRERRRARLPSPTVLRFARRSAPHPGAPRVCRRARQRPVVTSRARVASFADDNHTQIRCGAKWFAHR